jgi:hypothetical protein
LKEIRIHGRGGQGAVLAAELLVVAAFQDGKYGQAFPFFGGERRGAPVQAFIRLDTRPVRIRYRVTQPDSVIVLDRMLPAMNEAYMNTGVQRSSATPVGASTMTTPPGAQGWGKERPKKNLPAIALAHGIPYVATASIAYPKDLVRKVRQAVSIQGPKYIEVHSPCPIGWGFDSAQTVEIAKLAVQTGLMPLYEAYPDQPLRVRKIPKRRPVTDYLRPQKRFRHLFDQESGPEHIAAIQAIADDNIVRLGLGA